VIFPTIISIIKLVSMDSSIGYQREQESEDLYAHEDNESMKENIASTGQSKNTYRYPGTNRNRGNLNTKTSTHQNDFMPLSSTRDPRRRPLLDRLPFAPMLHHGDGTIHKTKKGTKNPCEVTPAYAFRNVATGLLEIKSLRPPDSYIVDVEMCSGNSENKEGGSIMTKPALYPIALNGGGVGIYNDPREFGVEGITNYSKNKHSSAGIPSRGLTVFPWNLSGGHSDEKVLKRDSSIEGLNHTSWVDNSDIEASLDETLRLERRADYNDGSVFSPWKTWEKVHNCMVRIAERTQGVGSKTDTAHLPTLSSKTRLSIAYNEDDFDFALILKPKEVYAFWADLLDFQEENGVNAKEESDDILNNDDDDDDNDDCSENDDDHNNGDDHDISRIERGSMEYPIDTKPFQCTTQFITPDAKRTKRRRTRVRCDNEESLLPLAGNRDVNIIPQTEPARKSMFSPVVNSPPRSTGTKLTSIDSSGRRVFNHRRSLFDRAITAITPPKAILRGGLSPIPSGCKLVRSIRKSVGSCKATSKRASSKSPLGHRASHNNDPSSSIRTRSRRKTTDATSNSTSQSITSRNANTTKMDNREKNLPGSHQNSSPCKGQSARKGKDTKRRISGKRNRNRLEIEDISTQVVPRGIAARTSGMEEFLSALKRGIVIKRHRSHADTGVSIKITSADGGDTMQYTSIKRDEAILSLNEQMVRYNRDTSKYSLPDFASARTIIDEESSQQTQDKFLPDHIAAEKYRDAKSRMSGGIRKRIIDLAAKAAQSGTFRAADIVAVHRANTQDPFSSKNEFGSCALRESKAAYNNRTTFSLVLLSGGIGWSNGQSSLKIASEMWLDGNGSSKAFRYLDIEAATEGEFWMIFRGFLLLQRDAASGRFAAERASGFSSNYNKRELEYRAQQLKKEGKKETKETKETKDAVIFQEPEDAVILPMWAQRIFYRKRDKKCKQINSIMPQAPPSDYFLGFKSPGTKIWSRLRQAGLETNRIYALDKKKVMIKVRCPTDRLMDIAEALRLKLKTTDGFYAPFQENSVNQFVSSNDADRRNGREPSLFRSSERQQIIDFIIRSRIRNFGAELGEDKKLGKDIELRVPIHMHARLEGLYISWVLFYKEVNWVNARNAININGRQGNSNQLGESRVRGPTPSTLTRFIVGSFNQPLDSVEEYFGEKVTFYFAWLQHCSLHLISLSAIGLIVFLCQVISGQFDHPLRPYFSVIVMIWSFCVLVHWRKRQNFLAHRWGTMNYKVEETTRPQFHGEWIKSEIAGELEHVIYYPYWKRWLKYCISIPLTAIFTITLLIGMLVVYANRDIFLARYFSDHDGIFVLDRSIAVIGKKEAIGSVSLTEEHLRDPKFWYIIAGIPAMLGLTLPLFNFILMQISRMLNEFENHRTETQYRSALIIKVIAFRFVCYFAALYYYAYIATGTDQIVVENGILRVASCLLVYFTVANWWSIFLTIYLPLLLLRWRLYRDRLKLRIEVRKLERMELGILRKNISDERVETERKLINKRLLLEQAQSKIWEEVMLPDYDPFPGENLFHYIL